MQAVMKYYCVDQMWSPFCCWSKFWSWSHTVVQATHKGLPCDIITHGRSIGILYLRPIPSSCLACILFLIKRAGNDVQHTWAKEGASTWNPVNREWVAISATPGSYYPVCTCVKQGEVVGCVHLSLMSLIWDLSHQLLWLLRVLWRPFTLHLVSSQ